MRNHSDPHPRSAIETLRGFYAAELDFFARGGPDHASTDIFASFVHPDITVLEADGLPYAGEWKGIDGVVGLMKAISAVFDRVEIAEREFIESGDVVVVGWQSTVRSRTTGRSMVNHVLQHNTVVAGRITTMRPFHWDTAAVRSLITP